MNTRTTLVSDVEAAKSVQPRQGALDDPARASEATAVRLTSSGQHRNDAALTQFAAVSLGIVATVALQTARFATRRAGSAADGRHRVDEVEQFGDVIPIGGGQPRD